MSSREFPDIREQIAVAGNASDLSPDGHAARINGALGAAAMRMVYVPERDRLEARKTAAGTAQISPSRRLSALLERAAYANDRSAAHQAAILFAHYLTHKPGWCNRQRLKHKPDLLFAFAAAVVTERIYDRCPQCGGGGFVAVGKGRTATTAVCGVCRGGGRGRVDHGTRASVIGVGMEAYKRHWEPRFDDAHRWLADVEACNLSALQRQLRRDTLRSGSE